MSNAVTLNDSMPADCLVKVVNKEERDLVLQEEIAPNVTLRPLQMRRNL